MSACVVSCVSLQYHRHLLVHCRWDLAQTARERVTTSTSSAGEINNENDDRHNSNGRRWRRRPGALARSSAYLPFDSPFGGSNRRSERASERAFPFSTMFDSVFIRRRGPQCHLQSPDSVVSNRLLKRWLKTRGLDIGLYGTCGDNVLWHSQVISKTLIE